MVVNEKKREENKEKEKAKNDDWAVCIISCRRDEGAWVRGESHWGKIEITIPRGRGREIGVGRERDGERN